MKKGMGSHQSARMMKDEWLTPPSILQSLGVFDLDPCAPIIRPWDTALHHYTVEDDGLSKDWFGRVWLNPPYGLEADQWLERLIDHKDGVALIFARTETKMFFSRVWNEAHSVFFFEGRLYFHHVDGTRAKANAGAPSVLVAYGEQNSDAISSSGLQGQHITLRNNLIIYGVFEQTSSEGQKSWRVVVGDALAHLDGEASLDQIYDTVVDLAPRKVQGNKHYKAKIRQQLGRHFEHTGPATYKC